MNTKMMKTKINNLKEKIELKLKLSDFSGRILVSAAKNGLSTYNLVTKFQNPYAITAEHAVGMVSSYLSTLHDMRSGVWDKIYKEGYQPIDPEFFDIMKNLIQKLGIAPKATITNGSNSPSILLYKFDDFNFFATAGKDEDIASFLLHKDTKEKILYLISRKIYEVYGNTILISAYKKKSRSPYESDISKITILSDTNIHGFQSKHLSDINKRIKKYLESNVSRSIVLYGQPGTGKTTMAKMLVNSLNMKTIRLPIDELSNLTSLEIINILNCFKPDCVIIDDFDKVKDNIGLLDIIEKIHKETKLLICTANSISFINSNKALARPGRIDEFIKVENIDIEVVALILGENGKDYIEQAKHWPAAYIKELKNRIDVCGVDDVSSYIEELNIRAKNQIEENEKRLF